MIVEPYSPEDREGVLRLYLQFNEDRIAFGAGDARYKYIEGETPWANTLNDRNCKNFVAKEKGIVLGFITTRILEYNPFEKIKGLGEIDLIVVERSLRRRGIGTILFKRAAKHIESQNASHILLNVSTKNLPAIKFWTKMGFQAISKSCFEHHGGEREEIVYMMGKSEV